MSNLQTACKYFGCQIEVNGNIHAMWGIVPDGVWYTENRTNKVAKWGEWKPILKELRDITDEDAVWVASMESDNYTVETGRYIVTRYLKHVSLKTFDFLRSRYYDIDNVLNTEI